MQAAFFIETASPKQKRQEHNEPKIQKQYGIFSYSVHVRREQGNCIILVPEHVHSVPASCMVHVYYMVLIEVLLLLSNLFSFFH